MNVKTPILIALALVFASSLPVAAAPIPEVPCPAEVPDDICNALPVLIGDRRVKNNEEVRYEDNTFVAGGEVVVENGGRIIIENATFRFSEASTGIQVEAGGTLIIDDSLIAGHPSDPGASLIRANASATLRVTDSELVGLTLESRTNDMIVEGNDFVESTRAVVLDNVTATLEDNRFFDNGDGVRVKGGSPTIRDNRFYRGQTSVNVTDSAPTVESNTITDAVFGIRTQGSAGSYLGNAMDDKGEPPTRGIWASNCSAGPSIADNSIRDWGIGILLDNCSGSTLSGNSFHGNLQDLVTV